MFVVQVLFPVLFEQDRKIIVCFYRGFEPLPVDKVQGENLVLPDGFVEKFLLNIGPEAGRCIGITLFGRSCLWLRRGNRKEGMGSHEKGYFLLQKRDNLAVFFKVDFISADIPDDSCMVGFVHLADM